MPSFKETTINCDCLKCDFNIFPMFCVWDKSKAASTSSKMYKGAGLNNKIERINDNAARDL